MSSENKIGSRPAHVQVQVYVMRYMRRKTAPFQSSDIYVALAIYQ